MKELQESKQLPVTHHATLHYTQTHTHTHTHTRSDLHTALATLCLSWPAANCEAPNQLTMQQPGSSHSQKTNKHTTALYLKHSHVNIMNYCTAHTQNILGATHRQSGLVSQHLPNPELEDETLVCLSGMAAPFSCRFKTTMLFFFFFVLCDQWESANPKNLEAIYLKCQAYLLPKVLQQSIDYHTIILLSIDNSVTWLELNRYWILFAKIPPMWLSNTCDKGLS